MRRVFAAGILAVLSYVMATTGAHAASADFSSSQIIEALNRQRAEAGIPPVREDAKMAAGCAAYNDYVMRNGLGVADEHFENPKLPGYTAAGDHAARTSVLAYEPASETDALVEGDPFYDFGWAYGDPWDATHRRASIRRSRQRLSARNSTNANAKKSARPKKKQVVSPKTTRAQGDRRTQGDRRRNRS